MARSKQIRTTPKAARGAASLLQSETRDRISTALTGAISYNREPTLFDNEAIARRDAELKVERKGKPVYLTPMEHRIVYALAPYISKDMEMEDIAAKIDAYRRNVPNTSLISRTIPLNELSTTILNSTRARHKVEIIRNLLNVSKRWQLIYVGEDRRHLKPHVAPLIQISGMTLKEGTILSAEEIVVYTPEQLADMIESIDVVFGKPYFFSLDNKFAYLAPNIHEVWRESGHQTDLYAQLQSTLLTNYYICRKAAGANEARAKKLLNKTQRVTQAEYKRQLQAAREEALCYELNVSTIKAKVVTDYDSTRFYKHKFWKDLDNAAEGFIKLDLIKDLRTPEEVKEGKPVRGYDRVKGAKGQEIVIFHYSDTYTSARKQLPPPEE